MFVRSPDRRSQSPEQIDERIVAEGLQKHRRAARLQRTSQLGIRFFQIEMVKDSDAARQIERVVAELKRLRVHREELHVLYAGSRRAARSDRDRDVGDVDTGHHRGVFAKFERMRSVSAAEFEDVSAARKFLQAPAKVLMRCFGDRVGGFNAPSRAVVYGKSLILQRFLALFPYITHPRSPG